jgi:cell division protein FtsN
VELIDSEKDESTPLAEPEQRYRPLTTEKNGRGQNWLRLLVAGLIGVILVILIVLFARWVYHKTHHKVQPAPTVSQNTPAKASNNNNVSGAQPSNNSSSQSSGNPSNTTGTSGSTSNTQITNTGPGDVAAIFAGTALAAAGLHYIISIRRFGKPGA